MYACQPHTSMCAHTHTHVDHLHIKWDSLVAEMVKDPSVMQGT